MPSSCWLQRGLLPFWRRNAVCAINLRTTCERSGSTTLPAEAAVLPEMIQEVGWSDQRSFWQFGWPAIMVTDTAPFRNPNYHGPTDTPDTLDYEQARSAISGTNVPMQRASMRVMITPLVLAAVLSTDLPPLMQEGDVPGLSVAVIRNGRVVEQRGFGVANRDDGQTVTDRTIFEAASLSKPVFAFAVLKLVDRGVLDLDRPLDDPLMPKITARMVLSHSTGLQNEVMPGQTLRVHFTPGDRFSYSGEGFALLQRAVERLTGKRFDRLIRELVFEPLGMKDSSYVWQTDYEARKAFGHNEAGVATGRRKPLEPKMSSLHTTAGDYARFMIAVMNGTGLKRSTTRAMLSRQSAVDDRCYFCLTDTPAVPSKNLAWGLGWGLETTPRGTAFWHWGENNGDFHAFAMGYRDSRDGVVVLTNSGNGHSIMPEVVEAAIGGSHPAFAWMRYDHYRAPVKVLLREILAEGAASPLSRYRGGLTEGQLNRIGYALMARKRFDDAVAVMERNAELYPKSANAHDSLGEAYAHAGASAKAVASYEMSLALDPKNTNAAEWLKKLRQ